MSYAQIKPQYYQMHMPDSPWHAGSEGWKSAPWPSFGVNPNLVGPPRLAVEGLGAYFKPVYEKPISGLGAYFKPVYERAINGLGLGDIARVSTYRPMEEMSGLGCPCAKATGAVDFTSPSVYVPAAIIAGITGLAIYVATRK